MNVLFGLIRPDSRYASRSTARNASGLRRRTPSAHRTGHGAPALHAAGADDGAGKHRALRRAGELVRLRQLRRARRKLHRQGLRQSTASSSISTPPSATSPSASGQVVEILKMLYRDAQAADPRRADRRAHAARKGPAASASCAASRQLARSIIIITHKLDEVMEIADQRQRHARGGKLISCGPSRGNLEGAHRARDHRRRPACQPDNARRAARATWCCRYEGPQRQAGRGIDIGPLTFGVRAGEIVGIAGVSGNGQAELIQALAGPAPHASGDDRALPASAVEIISTSPAAGALA